MKKWKTFQAEMANLNKARKTNFVPKFYVCIKTKMKYFTKLFASVWLSSKQVAWKVVELNKSWFYIIKWYPSESFFS